VPFEEALELPLAIQSLAGGHAIRRLRLFELLSRSPDSGPSRMLLSNSARYGLTTGTHNAEWIELTAEGRIVTSDESTEREKIRVRFRLAIEQIAPFRVIYENYVNTRVPAKPIIVDFLRDQNVVSAEDVSECVDIFLLNAKYVGILQVIAGAERLVTLDYVLDYAPAGVRTEAPAPPAGAPAAGVSGNGGAPGAPSRAETTVGRAVSGAERAPERRPGEEDRGEHWERICFYITPIGEEGSERRMHSDLFLGSIVEPALEEFGLTVVRADQINTAGIITRQILEHIVKARLVIADLSHHNPNVFYELALRHATGLPTVQIIRAADRLPFDVEPMRTIMIDTSSIYTLVPRLEFYRSAITAQVRQALENSEAVDNPVTAFYPALRMRGRAGAAAG
jgi:hypothetical protein